MIRAIHSVVSKVWDLNSTSVKLSCEINFFLLFESLTLTKMDCLTITELIKIIKTYSKNDDSATATYNALRGYYGLHNRPTTQAIGKVVKKVEETGVVTNIERPRSAENIATVSESIADSSSF